MLFYINQRKKKIRHQRFFFYVHKEIQLSLPFFWEEHNYRKTMWRWWLSITECHGIVKKGYMVYEIWGPDTITARWNIQLHHLSRDWSLGWLRPPPSWQHNLIYILCNGNYEEKNTRPFQANMVSIHLYIIKSIPFPNWTLPSHRAEWCCSLQIAINASRQELRTIQVLNDFCPLDIQDSLQYYLFDPQCSQTTIQFKSYCALFTHALTVSLTCALP